MVFVSIDGHSGAGKSTLAGILSTRLGASVVHIDDFSGLESSAVWWNGVIKAVFEPVAAGARHVTFTPASWGPGHHLGPITIPVTPIMLLEGVSSSRSEFDVYIGLRFYVDTPMDVCLARGIARDTARGRSKEAFVHMWHEWLDEELEFTPDTSRSRAAPKRQSRSTAREQVIGA